MRPDSDLYAAARNLRCWRFHEQRLHIDQSERAGRRTAERDPAVPRHGRLLQSRWRHAGGRALHQRLDQRCPAGRGPAHAVPPPGPSISRAARPTYARAIPPTPGSIATGRTSIAPTTSSSRPSTSTGLACRTPMCRCACSAGSSPTCWPSIQPLPRAVVFPGRQPHGDDRSPATATSATQRRMPRSSPRVEAVGARMSLYFVTLPSTPVRPARWLPGWTAGHEVACIRTSKPDRLPSSTSRLGHAGCDFRLVLSVRLGARAGRPAPTVRHHQPRMAAAGSIRCQRNGRQRRAAWTCPTTPGVRPMFNQPDAGRTGPRLSSTAAACR